MHGAKACGSHFISETKLAEIVRNDLEGYIAELNVDEAALRDRLIAMKTKELKAQQAKLNEQKKNAEARLRQLDTLLARVYEEMLLGVIPRDTLLDMSGRYNIEKAECQKTLDELLSRTREFEIAESDAENWIGRLKEYMNGKDLDNKLLRQLIKEIRIGAVNSGDNGKERTIEIDYRF